MKSELKDFIYFINSEEISDDGWGDVFYEDTENIYKTISDKVSLTEIFALINIGRRNRFFITLINLSSAKEIKFINEVFEDLDVDTQEVVASYLSDIEIPQDLKDKITSYLSKSNSKFSKHILKEYQRNNK
jgi:hypothetical protein